MSSVPLSEIIESFIPGDWGNESYSDDTNNNVFCVRGADIVPILNNDFTKIPTRYISNKSLNEKKLKAGDIVIEKSGGSPVQSTGRAVFITEKLIEEKSSIVCSNFCVAIRIKNTWNPKFVFYYWQHLYNSGVFFNFEGKTSGIKNLQLDNALQAITIPDYPLSLQKNISDVISIIDRKNALNREINRNLEALARQLYDYWFVQFDFPDENGRPYKSSGGKMVWNEKLKREIPEGWNVEEIGTILGKIKGSIRLQTDEYMADGKYPIIDQTTGVYYAGFTDNVDAVVQESCVVVFGDHSCAVKYVNFPFVRGADGTQILKSNDNRISEEYLYFAVKDVKFNKGYARHFSILKSSFIIIPNLQISLNFKQHVQRLFNVITGKRQQIIELTKQRDELLPLLMNGQVNCDLSIISFQFFVPFEGMTATP